jgi:hypothetical protein
MKTSLLATSGMVIVEVARASEPALVASAAMLLLGFLVFVGAVLWILSDRKRSNHLQGLLTALPTSRSTAGQRKRADRGELTDAPVDSNRPGL